MTSGNNRHPLVSIILPNRNHAHFLCGAIAALLGQSWTSLELIVIDDASTDHSRELIRNHQEQDDRLRYVALEQHYGIHRAVQIGLELARGAFVYIAAADDIVEHEFLERCVVEMERVPQAGVSFSDPSEFYRATGRKILFPLYLSAKPNYFDPNSFVALQARNYFHISPNTGIYRLAAFRAAGGYKHELDLFSDWFATMVVALRQGLVYLPEQLTCVAIQNDSYSAVALRDRGRRRAAFRNLLQLLSTVEYADVRDRLRLGAILPEYRFETLFWLLGSSQGRDIVTTRLLCRIVARASWSYMRNYAALGLRRGLRKWVNTRGHA